ncbi:carbamoyltransferase C-terminal domain-containing protein [Pseudopedobacter sp.]|uniref:carbamoyltransferase family protein n=1 Tax=Pseudopedobacter sp. TaxID=1936787 RepID=UPI003340D44F
MYTLGINAVFHDSSACIIKDGELIAAAEDERFTHFKHGKRPIPFSTYELPFHAIDFCLKVAGIHLNDVDHIAYSFDPYEILPKELLDSSSCAVPLFSDQRNFEADLENPWNNLFLTAIINAENHLVDGYPHHLQKRFYKADKRNWKWHFVNHHLAHAASAFLPSPFSKAAILTLDGRGENCSTTYSVGLDNDIKKIAEVKLPHSLGLLYEKVTTYLGFLHSSDEYKVMALASYGKPEFIKDFREIIQYSGNGQYQIADERLEERFGPARLRGDDFTSHHFDIARSLQYVLEETVLEICDWLYDITGEENLCIAGGVGLNCVLNARIRDKSPFKNVWVQPAAGDSGTALGAALWIDAQLRETKDKDFVMEHVYWGPDYSDNEIEAFLKKSKIPYHQMNNVAEETASLLAENKIIGWFQGKMEYGPRSLGSRSILASPIDPKMQSLLNIVKDREDFRPVAPVVLEEDAHEWFENAGNSPFMLFIYNVVKDREHLIPAVKHIDGTARVQTINEEQHPLYYQLIKAFKEKTGVPVLVNTSFNTLGKPIVCSPRDAIECFWTSPFDALVIGSFLIRKDYGNKNFSSYTNIQETQSIEALHNSVN